MEWKITYTLKGKMNVFTDVVVGKDIDDAIVTLKEVVKDAVGEVEVVVVLVKPI